MEGSCASLSLARPEDDEYDNSSETSPSFPLSSVIVSIQAARQGKAGGMSDNDVDSCDLPERGKWTGKLDFIFGCISYAVGLGNVWRFPYLCYENGGGTWNMRTLHRDYSLDVLMKEFQRYNLDILGLQETRWTGKGAFLVPYILSVILCGIPLFVLEVSIGQYLSTGGIGIWNLVPIFKGIGYASMTMIGLCNVYYIVLIAYTLFYFVASFSNPLPWEKCNNEWNTGKCVETITNSTVLKVFLDKKNMTLNETVSPVKEYWEKNVLQITDGLEDAGSMRTELALYLLLAWFLVYLVIWRGLHQSGKIIWFTALFPYVILLILFGRGITLEGATDGLLFYIQPKWEKLQDPRVWVSAGTQVLFSYGVGIGANVALGSYNKFHHNFYRDSVLVCCISSATSLFAGVVIFSVLGHMAFLQQKDIAEVARSGPGLAFLAYPEVVAKLPLSPLWATIFFLMLIILGIDSQFCTVESLVTGVVDEFARTLRPHRKLFTFVVVVVQFLLGLPLVTQGGMYLFQLMDFYSASGVTLLTVVFFEIAGFAWIYGVKKIYNNIKDMLGFQPSYYFFICWIFFAPAVVAGIFLFSVVKHERLVYANTYTYPWWGEMMGWGMSMASILWIPFYAICYLLRTRGTLKEWS